MEIRIIKDVLVQALGAAQGFLSRTDNNAALACVKIVARAEEVTITATDTLVTMTAKYPATIVKEDEILVDGKMLFSLAKLAPCAAGEEIALTTIGSSRRLRISTGESVQHLNTLDVDQFPPSPIESGKASLTLTGADLDTLISQTYFAVHQDENKYGLCGAHLHVVKGKDGAARLRMVATDGSRLGCSDVPFSGTCALPKKSLLSKKGLAELRKLIDKADEVWTVTFADRATVFSSGSKRMTARNVEGEFPDYEQVLPDSWKRRAKFERGPFEQALRRVGLFATDKCHSAAVEFMPGMLVLTGENVDTGDVREQVKAEVEGEPLKTGFNIQYLQDVLGCTLGDLTMEIGDVLDPCIVRAEKSPGFLAIVMPMRLD